MNIRTASAVAATVAVTSIAAAVVMASPAEAPGASGYFLKTEGPWKAYKPTPRPEATHPDRSGVRKPLKVVEHVVKPSATPKVKHPIAKPPADIRISFYKDCSGFAQRCIDAGTLTMYAGNILAGHNYMGYQWLSRVPVGKRVIVVSGPLAGTYRVYGHMRLTRQGGSIPGFGGAALVLQSCEGSGTGFSLLRKV